MGALNRLHQLADQCRQQCGFFVSVGAGFHACGGESFSVLVYTRGEQIASFDGDTSAEVADQLAEFIAERMQEAA
ncbi:hypothetical protein [Vreelandella populi]|uniref:hypothetical protein n=1 Tax=Vreelandella populi TaxID=2498858 RepID=UPI000F8D66AF|nr:hypothetical protein [Halomonas populi]RUR38508.1 hypothetical protein ELY25_09090 [Halomonas populi]